MSRIQNKHAQEHAIQHLANIQRAVDIGYNKATKDEPWRKKRDRGATKTAMAAEIAQLPAEIFKWCANSGNGTKCESPVCRASKSSSSCLCAEPDELLAAESRLFKNGFIVMRRILAGLHNAVRHTFCYFCVTNS